MPRTVFALPVQEIPPSGGSRETRLLFLTAYIRPENEFRNATSKSFIIDEWTELTSRPDVQQLIRKGRWVRDNRSRVYDEFVSELTNDEANYLRRLMTDVLPDKYRRSFDPIVEKFYEELQAGRSTDFLVSLRKKIMIEPFSMKVERARPSTLQKWMQYHQQGIGICYSVVTPRLDEMRCVREDKNAANTNPINDPINMRIKHGKQPFAVDFHLGKTDDLRTPTISDEMRTDLRIDSFNNILETKTRYETREESREGLKLSEHDQRERQNIELLRLLIKNVYENKVKDGRLRIGHIFTKFDVTINDTEINRVWNNYYDTIIQQNPSTVKPQVATYDELREYLKRFGVIVQNNKVDLLVLEQFLQRFGFVLDPENVDEWRRDDETGQPVGSKCKDYITNGVGYATITSLVGTGSPEEVMNVLNEFKNTLVNEKIRLPSNVKEFSPDRKDKLIDKDFKNVWVPILRARSLYRKDQFQQFVIKRQEIIDYINNVITVEEETQRASITGTTPSPAKPSARRGGTRRR